jgi:hypothetical protein
MDRLEFVFIPNAPPHQHQQQEQEVCWPVFVFPNISQLNVMSTMTNPQKASLRTPDFIFCHLTPDSA